MDINGGLTATTYRHRKSPSSDRFLGKFSLSPPPSSDFELTEADLFSFSPSPKSHLNNGNINNGNSHHAFRMPENSGILAALPGDSANRVTTPFRAIPKPPHTLNHQQNNQNQNQNQNQRGSSELMKFQHSAPVNVPSMMRNPKKFGQLSEFSEERENDEEDDEEMLPPHEIVAMKLKSTSSVLEGVGRTLKGRDLRQVRNAVWRQTGFLD